MQLEFDALHRNHTWTLVSRTSKKNIISNKWVFHIKNLSTGKVDKNKSRVVAKDFA